MTPEEGFGKVLQSLRKAKDISQDSLAAEGNLDRTFISLLERGLRQPSLRTIFQIAKALEISPDELIRLVYEKIENKNASQR